LNDWKKVREVAYYALIGNHVNPKHLPKSMEKFMPLEGDKVKKGVSEKHKLAFLKAAEEYIKKKNEQST
jgi:hypothetical protein